MTHRILACLGVVTLVGCSAMPVPPEAQAADGIDYARMALIDRAAALNGVKVLWINAPRKAVAAGG